MMVRKKLNKCTVHNTNSQLQTYILKMDTMYLLYTYSNSESGDLVCENKLPVCENYIHERCHSSPLFYINVTFICKSKLRICKSTL